MSEAHIFVFDKATFIEHHVISDGLDGTHPSELALDYPVPPFMHDRHEHAGKVHIGDDIHIAEGTTEKVIFGRNSDIEIVIAHTHEHPTILP